MGHRDFLFTIRRGLAASRGTNPPSRANPPALECQGGDGGHESQRQILVELTERVDEVVDEERRGIGHVDSDVDGACRGNAVGSGGVGAT